MCYWGVNVGAILIDGGSTASFLENYGQWLPLVLILVAYHIVLAWLVINAKHETGLSLSIPETIFSHLACLVVVLFFGAIVRHVPILRLLRYAIPALAPFERDWLFKARGQNNANKRVPPSKAEAAKKAAAVANAVAAAATVDDYQEWLKYLAQPNRPPRKPGTSVQDEYKQWLLARAKSRIAPRPRQ